MSKLDNTLPMLAIQLWDILIVVHRFFQSIFGLGFISWFLGPVFLYDQILVLPIIIFIFKTKTFKNLKNFYFKDYELLRLFIIYSIGYI